VNTKNEISLKKLTLFERDLSLSSCVAASSNKPGAPLRQALGAGPSIAVQAEAAR
jgi:hypothetical protein